MAEDNAAKQQQELKTLVEEQEKIADHIRNMKKNNAAKEEVEKEVAKLKIAKEKVEAKRKELNPAKVEFPRVAFGRLMQQRFFINPSFEIYGGIAGLFDLGPPGTAIKANLLNLWRQHFVLTENMLEVDCTSVTPEPVLEASGHVAKFADMMVKDTKTGSCYRADHLLEGHLETLLAAKDLDPKKADEYKTVKAQADAYSREELGRIMKLYGVKAPETNNDITDPEPFNLMFQTMIGPTGHVKGFLRPETAQGIFVNFKRLLEYNGGKLPFAAAQIGQAYRNEIAPRSGLLRVREFTLAEIEHFVNPEDKSHPKFSSVADYIVTLFPQDDQLGSKKTKDMTIGEAVRNKIVANETLGYFIVRVHMFLLAAGIKKDRLRFRQHLRDEMAHYACDCWDAEIQNSYGWVECVGIADRSAYDLSVHSKKTGASLTAFVDFPEGPRTVEAVDMTINKGAIGKTYKKKGEVLVNYLNARSTKELDELSQKLESGPVKIQVDQESFDLSKDLVSFKKVSRKEQGAHITPGVIEPSFGIGRILYSLLEHAYYTRENDEQRAVLALTPVIAPVKVSVLPLMQQPALTAFVPKVVTELADHGLSNKTDDTGSSIGKRYARTDEIGIPFGITIDHETIENQTITLRERDSTTQVRVKITEVAPLIQKLISGRTNWTDVRKNYPNVDVKEDK
eukprot:TRINITY_DN445_c0_g1_i1.p1 TRINITY_DN445_c0_g1~~TRINITY_DN445_c0_g1_i1.p1  ORF type:complete len:764 (-),score=226.04 TRINITY_DN445_c0_g1_i1:63-2102(-)